MSGILIPFPKEQIQSIYCILKITEEGVQKSLEELKVWYLQQSHLPKRYVETAFLRTVVIGSKNRIELAKQRIENYFHYRNLYKEYFTPRPLNTYQKNDILKRMFIALPKCTSDGFRILLYRPEYDDNLEDRSLDILIPVILFEILATEDNTFGGAIKIIADGSCFDQFGLTRLAESMKYLGITYNELNPCVLKKILYFNVNTFLEQTIALFKNESKEKLSKKIEILGKDDIEKLYEHVPKDILPVEYGGLEESYDAIREKYYQKLMDVSKLHADPKNVSADETWLPKSTEKCT